MSQEATPSCTIESKKRCFLTTLLGRGRSVLPLGSVSDSPRTNPSRAQAVRRAAAGRSGEQVGVSAQLRQGVCRESRQGIVVRITVDFPLEGSCAHCGTLFCFLSMCKESHHEVPWKKRDSIMALLPSESHRQGSRDLFLRGRGDRGRDRPSMYGPVFLDPTVYPQPSSASPCSHFLRCFTLHYSTARLHLIAALRAQRDALSPGARASRLLFPSTDLGEVGRTTHFLSSRTSEDCSPGRCGSGKRDKVQKQGNSLLGKRVSCIATPEYTRGPGVTPVHSGSLTFEDGDTTQLRHAQALHYDQKYHPSLAHSQSRVYPENLLASIAAERECDSGTTEKGQEEAKELFEKQGRPHSQVPSALDRLAVEIFQVWQREMRVASRSLMISAKSVLSAKAKKLRDKSKQQLSSGSLRTTTPCSTSQGDRRSARSQESGKDKSDPTRSFRGSSKTEETPAETALGGTPVHREPGSAEAHSDTDKASGQQRKKKSVAEKEKKRSPPKQQRDKSHVPQLVGQGLSFPWRKTRISKRVETQRRPVPLCSLRHTTYTGPLPERAFQRAVFSSSEDEFLAVPLLSPSSPTSDSPCSPLHCSCDFTGTVPLLSQGRQTSLFHCNLVEVPSQEASGTKTSGYHSMEGSRHLYYSNRFPTDGSAIVSLAEHQSAICTACAKPPPSDKLLLYGNRTRTSATTAKTREDSLSRGPDEVRKESSIPSSLQECFPPFPRNVKCESHTLSSSNSQQLSPSSTPPTPSTCGNFFAQESPCYSRARISASKALVDAVRLGLVLLSNSCRYSPVVFSGEQGRALKGLACHLSDLRCKVRQVFLHDYMRLHRKHRRDVLNTREYEQPPQKEGRKKRKKPVEEECKMTKSDVGVDDYFKKLRKDHFKFEMQEQIRESAGQEKEHREENTVQSHSSALYSPSQISIPFHNRKRRKGRVRGGKLRRYGKKARPESIHHRTDVPKNHPGWAPAGERAQKRSERRKHHFRQLCSTPGRKFLFFCSTNKPKTQKTNPQDQFVLSPCIPPSTSSSTSCSFTFSSSPLSPASSSSSASASCSSCFSLSTKYFPRLECPTCEDEKPSATDYNGIGLPQSCLNSSHMKSRLPDGLSSLISTETPCSHTSSSSVLSNNKPSFLPPHLKCKSELLVSSSQGVLSPLSSSSEGSGLTSCCNLSPTSSSPSVLYPSHHPLVLPPSRTVETTRAVTTITRQEEPSPFCFSKVSLRSSSSPEKVSFLPANDKPPGAEDQLREEKSSGNQPGRKSTEEQKEETTTREVDIDGAHSIHQKCYNDAERDKEGEDKEEKEKKITVNTHPFVPVEEDLLRSCVGKPPLPHEKENKIRRDKASPDQRRSTSRPFDSYLREEKVRNARQRTDRRKRKTAHLYYPPTRNAYCIKRKAREHQRKLNPRSRRTRKVVRSRMSDEEKSTSSLRGTFERILLGLLFKGPERLVIGEITKPQRKLMRLLLKSEPLQLLLIESLLAPPSYPPPPSTPPSASHVSSSSSISDDLIHVSSPSPSPAYSCVSSTHSCLSYSPSLSPSSGGLSYSPPSPRSPSFSLSPRQSAPSLDSRPSLSTSQSSSSSSSSPCCSSSSSSCSSCCSSHISSSTSSSISSPSPSPCSSSSSSSSCSSSSSSSSSSSASSPSSCSSVSVSSMTRRRHVSPPAAAPGSPLVSSRETPCYACVHHSLPSCSQTLLSLLRILFKQHPQKGRKLLSILPQNLIQEENKILIQFSSSSSNSPAPGSTVRSGHTCTIVDEEEEDKKEKKNKDGSSSLDASPSRGVPFLLCRHQRNSKTIDEEGENHGRRTEESEREEEKGQEEEARQVQSLHLALSPSLKFPKKKNSETEEEGMGSEVVSEDIKISQTYQGASSPLASSSFSSYLPSASSPEFFSSCSASSSLPCEEEEVAPCLLLHLPEVAFSSLCGYLSDDISPLLQTCRYMRSAVLSTIGTREQRLGLVLTSVNDFEFAGYKKANPRYTHLAHAYMSDKESLLYLLGFHRGTVEVWIEEYGLPVLLECMDSLSQIKELSLFCDEDTRQYFADRREQQQHPDYYHLFEGHSTNRSEEEEDSAWEEEEEDDGEVEEGDIEDSRRRRKHKKMTKEGEDEEGREHDMERKTELSDRQQRKAAGEEEKEAHHQVNTRERRVEALPSSGNHDEEEEQEANLNTSTTSHENLPLSEGVPQSPGFSAGHSPRGCVCDLAHRSSFHTRIDGDDIFTTFDSPWQAVRMSISSIMSLCLRSHHTLRSFYSCVRLFSLLPLSELRALPVLLLSELATVEANSTASLIPFVSPSLRYISVLGGEGEEEQEEEEEGREGNVEEEDLGYSHMTSIRHSHTSLQSSSSLSPSLSLPADHQASHGVSGIEVGTEARKISPSSDRNTDREILVRNRSSSPPSEEHLSQGSEGREERSSKRNSSSNRELSGDIQSEEEEDRGLRVQGSRGRNITPNRGVTQRGSWSAMLAPYICLSLTRSKETIEEISCEGLRFSCFDDTKEDERVCEEERGKGGGIGQGREISEERSVLTQESELSSTAPSEGVAVRVEKEEGKKEKKDMQMTNEMLEKGEQTMHIEKEVLPRLIVQRKESEEDKETERHHSKNRRDHEEVYVHPKKRVNVSPHFTLSSVSTERYNSTELIPSDLTLPISFPSFSEVKALKSSLPLVHTLVHPVPLPNLSNQSCSIATTTTTSNSCYPRKHFLERNCIYFPKLVRLRVRSLLNCAILAPRLEGAAFAIEGDVNLITPSSFTFSDIEEKLDQKGRHRKPETFLTKEEKGWRTREEPVRIELHGALTESSYGSQNTFTWFGDINEESTLLHKKRRSLPLFGRCTYTSTPDEVQEQNTNFLVLTDRSSLEKHQTEEKHFTENEETNQSNHSDRLQLTEGHSSSSSHETLKKAVEEQPQESTESVSIPQCDDEKLSRHQEEVDILKETEDREASSLSSSLILPFSLPPYPAGPSCNMPSSRSPSHVIELNRPPTRDSHPPPELLVSSPHCLSDQTERRKSPSIDHSGEWERNRLIIGNKDSRSSTMTTPTVDRVKVSSCNRIETGNSDKEIQTSDVERKDEEADRTSVKRDSLLLPSPLLCPCFVHTADEEKALDSDMLPHHHYTREDEKKTCRGFMLYLLPSPSPLDASFSRLESIKVRNLPLCCLSIGIPLWGTHIEVDEGIATTILDPLPDVSTAVLGDILLRKDGLTRGRSMKKTKNKKRQMNWGREGLLEIHENHTRENNEKLGLRQLTRNDWRATSSFEDEDDSEEKEEIIEEEDVDVDSREDEVPREEKDLSTRTQVTLSSDQIKTGRRLCHDHKSHPVPTDERRSNCEPEEEEEVTKREGRRWKSLRELKCEENDVEEEEEREKERSHVEQHPASLFELEEKKNSKEIRESSRDKERRDRGGFINCGLDEPVSVVVNSAERLFCSSRRKRRRWRKIVFKGSFEAGNLPCLECKTCKEEKQTHLCPYRNLVLPEDIRNLVHGISFSCSFHDMRLDDLIMCYHPRIPPQTTNEPPSSSTSYSFSSSSSSSSFSSSSSSSVVCGAPAGCLSSYAFPISSSFLRSSSLLSPSSSSSPLSSLPPSHPRPPSSGDPSSTLSPSSSPDRLLPSSSSPFNISDLPLGSLTASHVYSSSSSSLPSSSSRSDPPVPPVPPSSPHLLFSSSSSHPPDEEEGQPHHLFLAPPPPPLLLSHFTFASSPHRYLTSSHHSVDHQGMQGRRIDPLDLFFDSRNSQESSRVLSLARQACVRAWDVFWKEVREMLSSTHEVTWKVERSSTLSASVLLKTKRS